MWQTFNPLRLNDCRIRDFFIIIFSLQISLLVTAALDAMGLGVPLIRQIIGFIYLTFVPGFVILRALGIHNLATLETILFTIGTSISFLMFAGVAMNFLYPLMGISEPISILPVMFTISSVVLFLCLVCYLKERGNPGFTTINLGLLAHLSGYAILISLPLMSVLGVFLVEAYGSNILLLILLATMALLVLLVAYGRNQWSAFYPMAVFAISIALLYHFTLSSGYLVGWDINREYYFYRLVQINYHWNPTLPNNLNAMLSVVMLPNLFSLMLNIDGSFVFKIIYPILFSLVPLGLYGVYRRQTSAKIAFLSAFFFMSLNTFFVEMASLARQEIAELYVVLLVLMAFENRISRLKKIIFTIIFSASLVVSHYGLTYLYILYLFLSFGFIILLRSSILGSIRRRMLAAIGKRTQIRELTPQTGPPEFTDKHSFSERYLVILASALFLVVFALVWYTTVSSSTVLKSIISVVNRVSQGITSNSFPWTTSSSFARMVGLSSGLLQRMDYRVIEYITQLFILIGVIWVTTRLTETKFNLNFIALALTSLMVLLISFVLPYFASSMGWSRIYQFALFFLAPFCVLGGKAAFDWALKRSRKLVRSNRREIYACLLVSSVLVLYFLYNTGFVYEVTQTAPSSLSLSAYRMKTSSDAQIKVWFSAITISEYDVASSIWLSKNRNDALGVLADRPSRLNVLASYGMILEENVNMLSNSTATNETSYVFLSRLNTIEGIIVGQGGELWNTTSLYPFLSETDEIYSNGAGEIHFVR